MKKPNHLINIARAMLIGFVSAVMLFNLVAALAGSCQHVNCKHYSHEK